MKCVLGVSLIDWVGGWEDVVFLRWVGMWVG